MFVKNPTQKAVQNFMSSLSSIDNLSDYLLRSAPVLRAEFSKVEKYENNELLAASDSIQASFDQTYAVSQIDQIISKLSQVRTLFKSRETEIVNSNSTLRLLPTEDVFHNNLFPYPPSSSKIQPLENRQNSFQFIHQSSAVYRADNVLDLNSLSGLDFGFNSYDITNLSSGLDEPIHLNLNQPQLQLFSHSDIRSNSQSSNGFSSMNLSHDLRTQLFASDTTWTSRNKTNQPVVDVESENDTN